VGIQCPSSERVEAFHERGELGHVVWAGQIAQIEMVVIREGHEGIEFDERVVPERDAQAVEKNLVDEGRRLEIQAAPRAAAGDRLALVGKEAAGDRHERPHPSLANLAARDSKRDLGGVGFRSGSGVRRSGQDFPARLA
jgi:hypothetical protein